MTPWVLRLLIANVAVFFATSAMPVLVSLLAFVPARTLVQPWTAFTYMFVHANFLHLFLNMLIFFFFGPRLEERLGVRSFLTLYFLSGLGGALFSFVFAYGSAVVGASGAVYGVLVAFAYYWPREHIYIWGVLPVQARWLALLMVVVTLYSGITGSQGGIAHFAHLGGIVLGYGYIRWRTWHRHRKRREWADQVLHGSRGAARERKKKSLERWRSIPVESLHELNRSEVRQLLRKAEAQGAASLSDDERAFLDRMADSSTSQ